MKATPIITTYYYADGPRSTGGSAPAVFGPGVRRNHPVTRVKDPDDDDPVTGWVSVTGHECPVCRLPMVPYPGSSGCHPTCA